jgi:hypothetical protein
MKTFYFYFILTICLYFGNVYCSERKIVIGPFTSSGISRQIEQNGERSIDVNTEESGQHTFIIIPGCNQEKEHEGFKSASQISGEAANKTDIDKTKSSEEFVIPQEKKHDLPNNEADACKGLKDGKLINHFKCLDVKLKKVTKFYHYYDLLSWLDKIIALIYEFLVIPNSNISRNSMILRRTAGKVNQLKDERKNLFLEVNEGLKKNNLNSPNFVSMKNEIVNIAARSKCLNKCYNPYEIFYVQKEYYLYNPNKHKKLVELQKKLQCIRRVIIFIDKPEIEKFSDFFNNKFLEILSEVHDGLIRSLKEEDMSLNWLFEILDYFMNETKVCIEKLNMHNKFLKKVEKR